MIKIVPRFFLAKKSQDEQFPVEYDKVIKSLVRYSSDESLLEVFYKILTETVNPENPSEIIAGAADFAEYMIETAGENFLDCFTFSKACRLGTLEIVDAIIEKTTPEKYESFCKKLFEVGEEPLSFDAVRNENHAVLIFKKLTSKYGKTALEYRVGDDNELSLAFKIQSSNLELIKTILSYVNNTFVYTFEYLKRALDEFVINKKSGTADYDEQIIQTVQLMIYYLISAAIHYDPRVNKKKMTKKHRENLSSLEVSCSGIPELEPFAQLIQSIMEKEGHIYKYSGYVRAYAEYNVLEDSTQFVIYTDIDALMQFIIPPDLETSTTSTTSTSNKRPRE